MAMKRASYRAGIQWIADNDEPECMEESEVAFQVSSLLLADLFGVEPERVGRDVVKRRKKDAKPLPDEVRDPSDELRVRAIAAWRADAKSRNGKFGEQVMVRVPNEDSRSFRCGECGANVFTRLSKDRLSCNGCRAVYVSDKDAA